MYRIWFSNIHTKMYQVHKDLTTTKKSFKADSNRYGEGVAGGYQSILYRIYMLVYIFAFPFIVVAQTSCVENG